MINFPYNSYSHILLFYLYIPRRKQKTRYLDIFIDTKIARFSFSSNMTVAAEKYN